MKKKYYYFTLLLTLFSLLPEVKAQNCSINAGGNVTICGTSHTLAGSSSGSQSGLPTWIIVSKPSGAPDPIISDINSYTPLVSGLNFPGNYTFEIQQNCTSGSVSSQVTITAPGAVSTFTAGADITNVPATVGEVTLNGVVPAGYTAQWTAINIYNNERFGQVNSANAEFTSTTSPTTTFRLIKKANHDVDPAYRVRLKITSTLNPNCSYEDELIVRFIPNPEVSFVNVSNCLGTDDPSESYYVQFASNSPIFATRENNVSGNPAFGTTVSINVVSQPAGANMTYKDISVNRLFLNGTDVIGTYVFTVTVTNASGSFTTPNVSYTNNGMNVSPVSFITPDRPEQIAAYSIGLSGGEVHCASMAGTHTPITFLFTIDPSDPASVITTISNRGVAPPGGFPTFILNGAGTHNRSVTLTPPATGWSVGTYRIGIVTRSVSGACSRSQDYFIHISDGNREDVSVDDITVCYPGSGSVTAIVPLPEIYQQVVNSSYLQDFRGMYQFATLSRPAGSAVPVFQSADQRTLTHTSTTISNLNREGEYVFSIQALPSTGGVGPFLEKEYECSDASLIGTFKIYVSSQVNANAGSDKTINCISETTLNGNNPGVTSTGIWTIVSKPAGAPDPVFSNPTLYNTTVSSLTFAGNYVFRWTITTGECTSFDDVTVNVTMDNCPNPNCLPNLFLSQNGQLFDILTDTNPFTFPPIGNTYSESYNALGFNPIDGYLYAIGGAEQSVARLLKINPITGATQVLGNLVTPSGVTVPGTFVNGEFDHNGNYYIKGQSASGMYKVNVTTLVASAVFFSPAGNYNSADFAYNIQDGLLYATRSISGQGTQLFSINPANGQINDIGTPHLPGITFGAMFGDSEGRIFGSSNGGGFYQFNLNTGEKILISDSPASTNNDGAHCVQTPISFGADPYVTKTNPDPGYTAGQTTVFTVTVGNNGPFGIMGVGVTDLVPSGIPTANVTYSATAAGGAVTTVSGTQVGDINDVVNLPVGGTVTYTVTVNVPSSFNGNLTNSVELTISDNSSYDIDLTNNTASMTLTEPINNCLSGDCNENAFLFTSDPNTLEYDNLISGFHSSIAKQQDGNYLLWGQNAKPNTFGEHLYEPTIISPENGFNYTGEILKATLGTRGATNDGSDQYAILTTDGLYIWGGGDPVSSRKDGMVHRSVKDSQTFDKMTNANITNADPATGLPIGVTPTDVKMMFGSFATLGIVTCTGEAYVLSHTGNKNGDGSTDGASEYNKWHRVSVGPDQPLNRIVAMRGVPGAMVALTSDGELYTWGSETYLGDGSAKADRLYATQMTLPTGVVPKMIGMTKASDGTAGVTLNSYYLLSTTGELYSLGDNSEKQLGTFDNTERTSWVNVKSTNASTNMTDIVWISPNEHDAAGHAAVTALTADGKLWGWGMNHANMLGEGNAAAVDPRYMFGGLDHDEKVLAIETGGHINTIFKDCDFKLGYIGHNSNGSYANTSTSTGTNSNVFKFDGAKLTNLCAIYTPPYPEVSNMRVCYGETADLTDAMLNSAPAGYTLEWWTTINRTAGTEVTDPTTVTPGTYYAFFARDVDDCPNVEGEKIIITQNPTTVLQQDVEDIIISVNNDYSYTVGTVSHPDPLPSGYSVQYTWEYATADNPTVWNVLDNTTFSGEITLTGSTFSISHATKDIDGIKVRVTAQTVYESPLNPEVIGPVDCITQSNEFLITIKAGAVVTNPMLLNRAK